MKKAMTKTAIRRLFESVLKTEDSINSLELLNKFNSELEKYLGWEKYDEERMGNILSTQELDNLKKRQNNRCGECKKVVIPNKIVFYVKDVTNVRKRKMLCARCYKKNRDV